MEENIQDILANDEENVAQFNFENNTSSPVAITLLNSASLTTIPTSGNLQTSFSASNDLFPTLPPSVFALNPNNGTFIASDLTSPVLRLLNTTTNTNESSFDNSIGFSLPRVESIAIQPDGKILCGGLFTTYKGVSANKIIRLNPDGSIDNTFNYGTGFTGTGVLDIQIQSDGKIICVGSLATYNSISANAIIRLNPDGSVDATFNYGTGFAGTGKVKTIAIQPIDGKILIGGDFTGYNGTPANNIIRLNPDGSVDATFNYGTGFNNFVDGIVSIVIQSNGRILIGGDFTTYKGITENFIIRLNPDGSKDTSFDNSVGFNNNTRTIAIQSNGRILVGGDFATYKGVSANRIIRLNPDGSIDTSFDYGTGFVGSVFSIAIQPDGKILVVGNFTTYKGQSNNDIIRLNPDGSIDTSFDNSVGFQGSFIANQVTILPNLQIFVNGQITRYKNYINNGIVKLNSDGSSASTLNLANAINSIQYNSVNNKFYAEYSSGIYVISSDAQTIEADVTF